MAELDLIMDIIFASGIFSLIITLFTKLEHIEKNTERSADALEFILCRLEQDSADNVLTKIEEELNATSKEATNSR